jgi:hypothetical protein
MEHLQQRRLPKVYGRGETMKNVLGYRTNVEANLELALVLFG